MDATSLAGESLAGKARRVLRSREAGALESAGATLRAPFVLTHEGLPVVAAASLRAGAEARLVAEGEGARVAVEGALRAPSAAESARFAVFFPDVPALALVPRSVRARIGGADAELAPADLLLSEPAWKDGEAGILEHMNDDHVDAMLRMSRHFHGVEAGAARLIAVDPEGLHVRTDRNGTIPAGSYTFGIDKIAMAAVPEPRTALLAAAGLLGLGALGRRRAA